MRTLLILAILVLALAGGVSLFTTMQPMLQQIGTVAEFRAQATLIIFLMMTTGLILSAHRLIPAKA